MADLANSGTDSQTLTASLDTNTLTIAISDGNTQTVDLSSINTDAQNIAALAFDSSTNSLTVGITGGTSQTISLADLANSGTDSQTLTASLDTNTLTIAISDGNTQTVDLSSINTDAQNIAALAFDSSTNSLTVGITGGTSQTISLADLANSGTDSQTLALDGSATSTQTTLTISGGNGISLTTSGSLRFTQTATNSLQLYDTNNLPSPTGTNTNTTLRWDGTSWVVNTALQTDGSSQASITGNLNVSGETTLATTSFENVIYDADGDPGHPGQVLSATATGTNWISTASGKVTMTTNNYTALIDDGTVLVQPTSATTITLPTPSTADNGITLTVKRANMYQATGDTLQIISPVNIDGTSTILNLNVSYQGYTLQAFNGAWYITQRF